MENKEQLKLVGTNVLVYDSVAGSYIKKLREQSGRLNVEHKGKRMAIRQIGYETITVDDCKITTNRPIFLMLGEFVFTEAL